jgi:hypothetical protein
MPADSGTWAQGREAGRAAGRLPPVTARAVGGFIGGLPVGALGIFALLDRDPVQVLGTGVGLAVIIGAATRGSAAPPAELMATATARGDTYARAFGDGYAERLRGRRRAAALLGGTAGAVAGFGALVALLSQGLD